MELKLYTRPQTRNILGMGRTAFWLEEKAGKIKPVYVGKSARFTSEEIHDYLIKCTNEKESASANKTDSSKIS